MKLDKLEILSPLMLKKMILWCVLAAIIGVLSGVFSTLFLHSVEWAIQFRRANEWLYWCLPFGGLSMVWFYLKFGQSVEGGNNLIINEIHEPKKIIPLRMLPMIFCGAVFSHLMGASIGREGAAVQMGAAISDQFSKYLGKFYSNRRLILMMGMSAGFSSIFGTPIAGAIFGFEVLFVGTLVYDALLPCLVAAIVGFYTASLLGVVHTGFQFIEIPPVSIEGLISAIAAGIIFGYTAKFFVWSVEGVKRLFDKRVANKLYHPLFGGVILIAMFYLVGSDRYHSLGEEIINASFRERVYPWDFLAKIFTTSFSVGTGFRGGEVMSLFYIGSTLGNTLSFILPLSFQLLAALGFVAVFAGAVNTPIAGLILAFEIFGPSIGVYASLAIVASYLFSGGHGIYHSQRTSVEKNI